MLIAIKILNVEIKIPVLVSPLVFVVEVCKRVHKLIFKLWNFVNNRCKTPETTLAELTELIEPRVCSVNLTSLSYELSLLCMT